MFGRYEFGNANCTGENDSESWSFPANYERFSTVNVPKSRLGKRRTMEVSSQVKRDVLKSIKAESNSNLKIDNGDYSKESFENNQFLTHPVNSSVTPHKISNLNYKTQSKFNTKPNPDCKRNLEHLTPFRKENPQPLQEIKGFLNEQKLNFVPEKPHPSMQAYSSQGGSMSSEIRTVLNKSFEVTDGTVNEALPFCDAVPSAQSGDPNQSDVGNNSSFMTAHDIYNTEKNRVQCDSLYVKTPKKGFSLLDMLASPADPVVNISLQKENENLKNILLKTPGLNTLESFKTPYRPQGRIDILANEMFTPSLKSNSMTPLFKAVHFKSPSSLENGEFEKDCRVRSSEKSSNIELSNKAEIGSFGISGNFSKTTPPSNEKSTCYENDPCELPIPPSSEINVKKRIFEGLGWSLPHSSFSPGIKSKSYQTEEKQIMREISSVLLTPNNSVTNTSKHFNDCNINSSEIEVENSSVKVSIEYEQDFTPEPSVAAEDVSVDRSLHNQPSVEMLSETCDVDGIKTTSNNYEASLNPDSDNEANAERESFKAEDLSSLNNAVIKSCSLDVGFSNASAMQTNDCEQSLVSSVENSCLINTKDTVSNNEDTEMVTVQNVSIKSEVVKDVTVVAKIPDGQNSLEKKDVIFVKPSVNTEKSKEPILETPRKKEHVEEGEVFRPPSQPPIHGLALTCPRPIPKPQSNVVYVNKKPYTVLSMLGRGGSSEVYQVLDAETSKLMAMKFVNLASVEESIATGYLNEIEVLTRLQGCPSVIRMFDNEYLPESKILYVVMEKGDTDFSRLMKDIMKTKKMSMSMIIYYWTEMLNCVKDIHEKGIIHSDLKPANFLLVSGRLKLIDFGIASSLQGDMTSVLKDVTTGTFNYMSPEAIRNSGETRGHKITYKSDVWSLGCILYNLLYGKTPFSHLTNTWAKLGAIADPVTNVSFPAESPAPPHLLVSVRWALRKEPKERPTASELLKLAELTPGPESKLGRQISSLLAEYISQTFPNCDVKLENENSNCKHH